MSRAQTVEETYRVKAGLYVLGSLERGLTVYSQQVRAHNLIWALWQLSRASGRRVGKIAIVGGGIAGLTAAACVLARFDPKTELTLFEKREDLCPLQQGSDTRWLHPRIYNWPALRSRAPSASLPVLNWTEGRASDVARGILQLFGLYCQKYAVPGRLSTFIGLRHLNMNAKKLEIAWVGNEAQIDSSFVKFGRWVGTTKKFDIIILATGFGLETQHKSYPTESYWRNENYAQPVLDGVTQSYVVSGFGDGALIDLARLTIERHRQDAILYDIFGKDLEAVEEYFVKEWIDKTPLDNAFSFFAKSEKIFSNAIVALSNRIRKDTRVLLHLSGRKDEIKDFPQIFDGTMSSFLNRLFLYMLFRCGAFHLAFGDLDAAVGAHGVSGRRVLCRYGVDVVQHLKSIVVDFGTIEKRIRAMRKAQAQTPMELWDTGFFPHLS